LIAEKFMKVLLISPNREEINMRTLPLGLACVAAATRSKGHEVKLLDLLVEEEPQQAVLREVEAFDPEVIGFSVRNIDDQKMESGRFLLDRTRGIVTLCRRASKAPIVLGGAGYSIFPESTLDYLEGDMGIQGEGEVAFPLLLERLQSKEDLAGLPGLYLPGRGLQGKRIFLSDLETLPWSEIPAWFRLSPNPQQYWMTVQTRRGCPMGCSYCSTAAIEGPKIRKRNPRAVAEDIRNIMRTGLDQFYFTDNIFNLPNDYAKALCLSLKTLTPTPRWRCILYPGKIDANLAQLMAESGCIEASIGFESGSIDMLHSLNKHFTREEVRACFEILGDHGIRRMGFLLLGGPGETRDSVKESLTFADSLPLEAMKVTAGIRIYPQTPLAAKAREEGIITETTDLLFPTFYLAAEVKDWLLPTLKDWMAERPHWMM
jgi:radical SAM superfamily enzyme YgiQ (UPF0313 family)